MKASIIFLLAMIVVTAVVAGYRKYVARNEDDFLHLEDPTGTVVSRQTKTARALALIDHIGIGLTIATALYAAGLLVVFIYTGLQRTI
jgi:hypothetical protein